jgi:hypothetical protein
VTSGSVMAGLTFIAHVGMPSQPSENGSSPGVRLNTAEVPSPSVSSVQLNGQKTGDLCLLPGQAFVVMADLPAPRLPLPFGNIWLDLSQVLVVPHVRADDDGGRVRRAPTAPRKTQGGATPMRSTRSKSSLRA